MYEKRTTPLDETVLRAMALKRDELGHHGGSGIMFVQQELVDQLRAGEIVDVFFRPVFCVDQLSRASSGDPDVINNFLAVASGKMMQMLRTGKPSGPEDVAAGEPEWLGGVIEKWGEFYVFLVFSGASQEVDVKIAKVGLGVLPNYEYFQYLLDH